MRLYTIQSLDVIEILTKYDIYKPSWDKCIYLESDWEREAFERPYRWIVEQYNRIKKNEVSNPLVWWYTDIEEATQSFKHRQTTEQLLISADVDDKDVLLHDADLWEFGPFCNRPLGSISCEENYETFFKNINNWDNRYGAYQNNQAAVEETWKEAFVIQKSSCEKQRIHGLTSCIFKSYIKPRKPIENQEEFNEL